MKKYLLVTYFLAVSPIIFTQQTVFYDDFESYSDGDTVVNFSDLSGWGANGTGVAVNSPGNGAGGSDQFLLTPYGYVVTQFVTPIFPGEIYNFSFNGALTGSNAGGIRFQIIQFHGEGSSDDEIRVDFTLASVGGGQQNVFKLIDTSYNAVATDTGNVAFRILKNWGPEYKIDNFKLTCNSCVAPIPDLRVLNVLVDSSQSSSCNLSSAAQITVDLDNIGDESVFGFDINYSLNNGVVTTESFNDTIDPGSNLSVSLSQAIDLGWDGNYNLLLYGNNPNDTIFLNDTFSLSIENFSSYTNYEVFNTCDSLLWIDGNTYFSSSEVPLISYHNFENHNDDDDISSGSAYYVYGNGSTLNAAIDSVQGAYWSDGFAVMDTTGFGVINWDVEVESGETYEFKAQIKPGSFNAAALSLRINKNGNDIVINNHPGGNDWEEVKINWTADTTGQIIFRAVKGWGVAYFDEIEINQTSLTPPQVNYSTVNGCDSALMLDLTILESTNVEITATSSQAENYDFNGIILDSSGTYTQVLTNSAGCDSIITLNLTIIAMQNQSTDLRVLNVQVDSSQSSSCNLSSAAQITVDLDNIGDESIFGFDIHYSLNNSVPITENFNDTIASGSNLSVSLSQTIDLGWDGNYNLLLYGNNPTDTIPFNDTFSLSLENFSSHTNYEIVNNCDSLLWIDGNTYFTNRDVPLITYHDFENHNDDDDISVGQGYFTYGNGSALNAVVDSGQGAYWSDGFAVMDTSGFGVINWNIDVEIGETYEFKAQMKPGSFNAAALFLRINKNGDDIETNNHPGGNDWEEVKINWTADTTGQVGFRVVKTYGVAYFDQIEINQTSITPTEFIYTTENGCDSTIMLDLTILESTNVEITATSSQAENYDFNGTILDSTGIYTQILTNSVGCDSTITLDLTIVTDIKSPLAFETHIYPNPSKNKITISSDVVLGELYLRNIQGKTVRNISTNKQNLILDISDLSSGLYILEFNHKDLIWNKKNNY
jgi:hypothetical protein